MRTFQAWTISFLFLSCDNNQNRTTIKNESTKVDTLAIYTPIKSNKQSTYVNSDTIKRFVMDDYPVTNEMLADRRNNNSSYEKHSGKTYSYDQAWFCNDAIKQTIVFELYTDYHRMVTYHFYTYDIPTDLINEMQLYIAGGDLATEKQKQKDFNGFLNQSTKINSSYFVSDKGFKLGDPKQKAIDFYGKADKSFIVNGIEKLQWQFVGDELYDGKTDLYGKPLVKKSFGNHITMYFKNRKLVGQILLNDIP